MRSLIFGNLGLKISAVLISVFLWLFITWRGQSEMAFEAPVEFKNVPATMGLVNSANIKVNVTIKGQERLMKNVRTSDIRVPLDMGKAKKGEGIYYINKNDIKLPYAMSVISINPSSLKIMLDETVAKTVAVTPYINGSPQKGFYVRSVTVEPKSIKIYGLRSELRKIAELSTEPIDISGLTEDVVQELNVDIAGSSIRSDVNSVKVKIVISGEKR